MIPGVFKFVSSITAACFLLTACSNHDATTIPETQKEPEKAVTQTTAAPGKETLAPKPQIIEKDLSPYFDGHDASAVFYNADSMIYEVYNLEDAKKQSSPCSTFKIASSLAALEYGVITEEDSLRKWSGEHFWNDAWNTDISLPEAFKTSCIWYYRELINEIGQENMQTFLNKLNYGNRDITDWEGRLNQNNSNRSLTGFWVESSLMISPMEQVDMLKSIFENETGCSPQNVETLKKIMLVDQNKTEAVIYGKTGYGKLNNISLDSWFVGMFEANSETTYFAVHFSETDDPDVTSALAKEVAIQIIGDEMLN